MWTRSYFVFCLPTQRVLYCLPFGSGKILPCFTVLTRWRLCLFTSYPHFFPLLRDGTTFYFSITVHLTHNTQTYRYTNDTVPKSGLNFVMCDDYKCTLSLMEWFVYPLASYVLWQIFYLFVTEVCCRRHIEENPDVSTSMRWLSADRKNGFNKFCKMVSLDLMIELQLM